MQGRDTLPYSGLVCGSGGGEGSGAALNTHQVVGDEDLRSLDGLPANAGALVQGVGSTGRALLLHDGLEAAAGAAEGERKSAIVLTVSVLLSCAVGVLLTLTGGLVTLPLVGIVLYQAAWCVLALIFPLLQRY